MVDHDSRKRVAKNFRPFLFNFFSISKILQRFHQATQQQQPATNSSQQPAAASSNAK
jgi:hypothetical protein